ncbi:hypothetical protein [Bradyrhizobium sp. CCBAU 51627]|uniref:hypothetical protein n=1 Tax=Bradyrhizobium sp. CCBAU 51627 TaxID=1325088 RepID=UPI0023053A98|nr:hypothetical protein [Bradyrhizobium sp. CCBAU 51627]MDA9432086.1 hypothetical protein [Bradyrhizobium sp. CCBAU 51627]
MSSSEIITPTVHRAVDAAIGDLVRAERIGGSWFVSLPLIYPDGSFATVRIEQRGDLFRVSDNGFTWREAEDIDVSKRSFGQIAGAIAEGIGVTVDERLLYVEVPVVMLHRAICDVAETSWRIIDRLFERAFADNEEEEALAETLTSKLIGLFGQGMVDPKATVFGASTNEWTVSAIVKFPDHNAVFQAVGSHSNSIYKASTEFRDLSALKSGPRLIAVVKDTASLGQKLALLSPAKVLEQGQADELYRKAAA